MSRVILCPGEEVMEGSIRSNVEYLYDDGLVTVWKNGNIIIQQQVNKWRAYAICCSAGKVKLEKIYPPVGKCRIISWLCGAAPEAYCISKEVYEEMIQDYYNRTDASLISCEWDEKGDHYSIHWTKKWGAYSHPYSVACYINNNITKEEVLGLLPEMLKAGYGKWYIEKILAEYFNVTSDEFEAAMKKVN